MTYVAHAAVKLSEDKSLINNNTWNYIKRDKDIEYSWKLDHFVYHVRAGLFEDPNIALNCAKRLYVSLFYFLISNRFEIDDAGCRSYEPRLFLDEEPIIEGYKGDETFFFWTKHFQGGELGPGVFEVEQSIEEFDEYKFIGLEVFLNREWNLSFDSIDNDYFTYCREAQHYFNSIILADNSSDYGIKMTIYCGLLEHLSENRDKEQDFLDMIDELIKRVDCSSLSSEKKNTLKNYLNDGRRESSRKRCYALCDQYAESEYGGFTCKSIISEAYGFRSAFSHGENVNNSNSKCSEYIKLVVLDVVKNYFREKMI